MMPRTHRAGAIHPTTLSAAKLTLVCIVASFILQCAMAHPVDTSLTNVCDYAHLPRCIWEDLVQIRNQKSAASYTLLPILDIMALEVESAGYVKHPRSKQDQPSTLDWQHRISLCKWSYKLDVDYLRVPVHVATAVLDGASTSTQHLNTKNCECVPVKVKLPVTTFHTCSSGKEKWTMKKMSVNAGYTCKEYK